MVKFPGALLSSAAEWVFGRIVQQQGGSTLVRVEGDVNLEVWVNSEQLRCVDPPAVAPDVDPALLDDLELEQGDDLN